MENPKTVYLRGLVDKLESLGIPIYFESQGESTLEPFIEIGVSTGNTEPTAKTNQLIRDDTQHIDIYLPSSYGREQIEKTLSLVLKSIGKSRGITYEILRDDSIGRDVVHIPIRVNNLII